MSMTTDISFDEGEALLDWVVIGRIWWKVDEFDASKKQYSITGENVREITKKYSPSSTKLLNTFNMVNTAVINH
jgi:hypothetical protein